MKLTLKPWQYIAQGAVYALFALGIGYFATDPPYTHFDPSKSMIKVSFAHGAKAKGECRTRTAEELAKLAPNMRKKTICPRRRLPVVVEIDLDGERLMTETLKPTGLRGDGPSRTYRRFTVDPGPHRLVARLRDTVREDGFDYVKEVDLNLKPGQNLSVDFKASTGGFVLE